jgi:hypothetical protein
MTPYPYHLPGLIIRKAPNGKSRFALVNSISGKETSCGQDWRAAYDHWLEIRRSRLPVPEQISLLWLVNEFEECHRSAKIRVREAHTLDIRLIAIVLSKLGNPLVLKIRDVDCIAFRNAASAVPRLGPVRTETLIRRIRQAWRWGRECGWVEHECPFTAELRDAAIRRELSGIVVTYLPAGVLAAILLLQRAAVAPAEHQVERLSRAVKEAARKASDQAMRDGRLDLVKWLARCRLNWLLETSIDESMIRPDARKSVAAGRIERINQLRDRGAKEIAKRQGEC